MITHLTADVNTFFENFFERIFPMIYWVLCEFASKAAKIYYFFSTPSVTVGLSRYNMYRAVAHHSKPFRKSPSAGAGFCVTRRLRKEGLTISNDKYRRWKSPKGLAKIAEMYASGMSYQSIANKIGCDRKTLNRWLGDTAKCPTMRDEMQDAAIDACKPLEDAAWKAAQGFEYEERIYRPNPEGEMELVEKRVKYSAPQPMLLQFLLKNKKPNEYKDKQEIEADTTVTIRFDGGAGGADWDEISG